MLRAADRRWLDGSHHEPADRYRCQIFDAIVAIGTLLGPEIIGAGAVGAGELGALGGEALLGAGLGAEGIAAGSGLGAGIATDLATGITSDVLAGAGGLFGGGGATIGAGIGPALSGGTSLAEGFSGSSPIFSDLAGAGGDTFGGAVSGGSGGGVPFSSTPLTTGSGASALTPAATTVGGPVAAAPSVPASTGLSGAATGFDAGTTGSGSFFLTPEQAASGVTPAAAGGGGGGGAGAGGGIGSGLNRALSSVTGGAVNTSDLGLILSAGGLGMNLLKGSQPVSGQRGLGTTIGDIRTGAANLATTGAGLVQKGQTLEGFLNSGTLPPGLASGLKTATDAAKTHIRSTYASRGMSGSSAEAQDMQAAEDRAAAASSDLALKLFQEGQSVITSGISAEGQSLNADSMAAQLYNDIIRNSLAEDQALGSAIGNFASALTNSGRTTTTTTTRA